MISIFEWFAQPILNVFVELLTALASILPTAQGSSLDFAGALNLILNLGYQFGFIIPWSTIFNSFYTLVICQISIWLFKGLLHLIGLARGGH